MSKVSVLLAHYHEEAQPLLNLCLKSLEAQTFQDFELIVVSSNHVPKLSGRVDKEHFSQSRLHFPAAIQKAYELSDPNSEYILLLNDDCIMSHTCLEALVNTANTFPKEMILGARSNCGPIMGFYFAHNGFWLNEVPQVISPQFRFKDIEPFQEQVIFNQLTYPFGVFKVPFAAFFCTLIRRSTYEKVGKIDARFKTGSDDHEFALRASKYGISCWVAMHASVLHASGVTADLSLTDEDRNFNIQLLRQLV